MPTTVTVLKADDKLPKEARVGEDVEIEERLVEELRARGAIANVRRTLIAEAGVIGVRLS